MAQGIFVPFLFLPMILRMLQKFPFMSNSLLFIKKFNMLILFILLLGFRSDGTRHFRAIPFFAYDSSHATKVPFYVKQSPFHKKIQYVDPIYSSAWFQI